MPSWNIHLAVATALIKPLKIKNTDKFLVGNIIPDVLGGHILSSSQVTPHSTSHLTSSRKIKGTSFPNVDEFIKIHPEWDKNETNLGYVTHLLTDLFFNTKSLSKQMLPNYTNANKQHDFKKFGYELRKERGLIIPDINKVDIKECQNFLPVQESDIIQALNFLRENTAYYVGEGYIIFKKKELEEMLEECVNYIVEKIKEYRIERKNVIE